MCDFVFGFCLTVGLSVCWVSCVCLFFRLNKLCLAWGLSVCPSLQDCGLAGNTLV